MNYDEAMNISKVEFGQMPPQAFLMGLFIGYNQVWTRGTGKELYENTFYWEQPHLLQ